MKLARSFKQMEKQLLAIYICKLEYNFYVTCLTTLGLTDLYLDGKLHIPYVYVCGLIEARISNWTNMARTHAHAT